MPQEVLKDQTEVSRRSFLRTAASGLMAAGTLTSQKIAELFAQERSGEKVDVSKLSPNELLRMLPDEIPVKSEFGEEAKVEKCEVKDAKYLIVNLRNIHRDDGKVESGENEHPLVQRVIDASDDEIGQIMCILNRDYGFRYFGPEGFTYPEYKERMEELRKLPEYEEQVKALETRATRTGSMIDLMKATKIRELWNSILSEMRIPAPFSGLLELERSGKVELVPTESEEDRLLQEEQKKPYKERSLKIVMDRREDTCLLFIQRALSYRHANKIAMAWGADHWSFGKQTSAPKSVEAWNRGHGETKFSFALITPPSVYEYEEAEKLAKELREKK